MIIICSAPGLFRQIRAAGGTTYLYFMPLVPEWPYDKQNSDTEKVKLE